MSNEQLVKALEHVQTLREHLKTRSADEDESMVRNVDIMTGRCQSFADISCDVHGGLEFMPRASTLSDPHFSYRPPFFPPHLPELKVMSVDILPTALPLDASESFSNSCLPYLKVLVQQYKGFGQVKDYESERNALERATIAAGGKLVGKHEWLNPKVEAVVEEQRKYSAAASPHRKTVLLLGSGMVAKPTVDEICSRKDINLIIGLSQISFDPIYQALTHSCTASDNAHNNEQLAHSHDNASTATFSIHQEDEVASLVQKADVVIR